MINLQLTVYKYSALYGNIAFLPIQAIFFLDVSHSGIVLSKCLFPHIYVMEKKTANVQWCIRAWGKRTGFLERRHLEIQSTFNRALRLKIHQTSA